MNYDEIKALAGKEAQSAAEAMRQKAMTESGGTATEDALAEIYQFVYERVYAARLDHHENAAFENMVGFLQEEERRPS